MNKKNVKELIQSIKEKDDETEGLFISRKISVENTAKLLEIKRIQFEKHIRESEEKCEKSNKDDEGKYQCEKCDQHSKNLDF